MRIRTLTKDRISPALPLCVLLAILVFAGGCADMDLAVGDREPLTDQAYFAQLTEYAGQAADWSDELHTVASRALDDMGAAGSLDRDKLDDLMKEQGLVYKTIAVQAVTTDVWPPRYDSTELKDALIRGFSQKNWLGALASKETDDGGALLLVLTADMADPTVGQLRETAKEIWMLTNAYRRDHNLPRLEWDQSGAEIAQAKTEEMYTHGYFEHASPVTGDLAAQFLAFGGLTWEKDIRAMGENIAMIDGYNEDYKDASYWMDLWINSPEHRDNLLCEDYTRMGVSVYQGADGSSYAAQEFLTYMNELIK